MDPWNELCASDSKRWGVSYSYHLLIVIDLSLTTFVDYYQTRYNSE